MGRTSSVASRPGQATDWHGSVTKPYGTMDSRPWTRSSVGQSRKPWRPLPRPNTLLSGLGFESGGLAAAHSIHNGLTQIDATHDATHGEKVNIGIITQLILEGRESAFVEDYIKFSRELGLPVTLADIGIEDPTGQSLDIVAEAACDDAETIHNQPFEVTVSMVRDALKTVDGIADRVR